MIQIQGEHVAAGDQVTIWEADPVRVQDGRTLTPAADRSFEALIVCDEDWRPWYHAAACDDERSRKLGGAVGGVGLLLMLIAVGPVPVWVSALAFWVAVPSLALGAWLTLPRD